jgi:hypothetical protein
MKPIRLSCLAFALFCAVAAPAIADDASAAALFANGNFDAAADAYARVLAADPNDAAARLNLGALRLYQNDLAAAEPLLRAASASDPGNARAARLLAEAQRRIAEAGRRTTVEGGETTVAFVASDPLPVVRATIDGKTGNFLIDTGGTVDLNPDFASGLPLTLHDKGLGTFAGGKQAAIRAAMLQSVSLGGATAYDVPCDVFDSHASQFFQGIEVDGVIGTTLFERFLATIDYPKHRLILRPRSARRSAEFQAAAAAAGASIVPFWLVGDHLVFAQAQVNDAAPGLFLFDSGLAGAGLMPWKNLVEAAHIPLEAAHAGNGTGGGGQVAVVPFVADRVAVGTAIQRNVRGSFTPEGAPQFPFTSWGAVSNEFLAHYAYTVDFDAMKIVLARPE